MTIKIGWIGCGRHATWMLMPQLARSEDAIELAENILHSLANALLVEDASLTITLLDLRARSVTQQVLFQRTYRESEPAAKKNPGSVVEAMSRVMRRLSEKIISDVHAAVE